MTRLLYPSLQQPVLTGAQRPETVTESRWHQPLSEPIRQWARVLSVALIASSGAVGVVTTSFSEPTTIDRYWRPLAEPVRRLPPLPIAAYQYTTIDSAALTRPEAVTEDRWHQDWSRVLPANHPFFALLAGENYFGFLFYEEALPFPYPLTARPAPEMVTTLSVKRPRNPSLT